MKPASKRSPARIRAANLLGDLESRIMEILWKSGEMTVRAVHEQLNDRRPLAYTTVMTVMSRLAGKKLLTRRKEGQTHIYRAAVSRSEFVGNALGRVMSGFLEFSTPVLSRFVDAVGDESREKLDELARLIEQKRKSRS